MSSRTIQEECLGLDFQTTYDDGLFKFCRVLPRLNHGEKLYSHKFKDVKFGSCGGKGGINPWKFTLEDGGTFTKIIILSTDNCIYSIRLKQDSPTYGGKVDILELDFTSLGQAHRYVLLNHSKIQPFHDHFLVELQALKKGPVDLKTIEKLIVEEFSGWLQLHVSFLEKNNFDKEVLSFAIGPGNVVKKCNGFIRNGLRFLSKSHEEFKKTQNSGVVVEVEGGNYYVDIRPSCGLKKDKYGKQHVNINLYQHMYHNHLKGKQHVNNNQF
nr:hypothetical protein [Tanacetum cinerariifolium]